MQRFGPYVLLERIACGGMGEIYRAVLQREGGFERPVAVKRILPHLAQDQGFVALFENEARLTARLHHPNIVQIYDFGRADGVPWLAMEWVRGTDLRGLLRAGEGGRLHAALAVEVAVACCRALEHAYAVPDERGEPSRIVHRDVSPHNVLLSVDGEIKLTDFGLARALPRESITGSGSLKGKLAYMAPEQASGERADARTDVFGTGALLYECLAGRTLYDPEAPLRDVLSAILDARFTPLPDLRPDLPAPLVAAVGRALAAAPANRFPDAASLARALTEAGRALGSPPAPLRELVAGVARPVAGSPLEGTVAAGAPLRQDAGSVTFGSRSAPGFGADSPRGPTAVATDDTVASPPPELMVTRRGTPLADAAPRRGRGRVAAVALAGVAAVVVAVLLWASPPPGPSGGAPAEGDPPAGAGLGAGALSGEPPSPHGAPARGADTVSGGRGDGVGAPAAGDASAPRSADAATARPPAPAARRVAELAAPGSPRRPPDQVVPPALPVGPAVTVGGKTKRVPAGQADLRTLRFGAVRVTLRLVPGAATLAVQTDAKPYCEVRVDGQPLGTTPVKVQLARGRGHRLALWRGGLEVGATTIRWE